MYQVVRSVIRAPDLRVLFLSTLLVALSSNLVVPYLAIYLVRNQGVSAAEVAVIIGARFWSQQGLATLGGVVASRWGAAVSCQLGLGLRAVSYGMFALGGGFVSSLAAGLLLGLGGALYIPAAKLYISEAKVSDCSSHELFALRSMLNNVGNALGPLIGTVALVVSPQAAFIISGLAISGVVITLKNLDRQSGRHVAGMAWSQPLLLLRNGNIWVGLIAMFCFGLVYIQIEYSIPLLVSREIGASVIGALFLVNAVSVILWQLFVSRYVAKYPPIGVVVIGIAAMGISLSVGHVGNLAGVLGMVIIFSMGEALVEPAVDAQLGSVVGSAMRGVAFGLAGLFMALGAAAGTSLAATVIHDDSAFLFISGGCVAIVPLLLLTAIAARSCNWRKERAAALQPDLDRP